MRLKIGFDVDGVLARFDQAYENLLAYNNGTHPRIYGDEGPDNWNYDSLYYPKDVISRTWNGIKSSYFWQGLPPTRDFPAFCDWYRKTFPTHHVFFITNRPGETSLLQTQTWLWEHTNMVSGPVVVSDQKGDEALHLGLDFYVDDKAENVQDVMEKSPRTRVYLLDKAYNRHMDAGIRIPKLEAFLSAIDQHVMDAKAKECHTDRVTV